MVMEQSEGFKLVEGLLEELEHQLSLCDGGTIKCEQSAAETEREIEVHFAMCMDFLVARKATLLKEVSQLVEDQST
jgi:hypothetical protein